MSRIASVESIFSAALEKASPEERAAFLDKACGNDQALRQRIERLLNAHPQIGSFLQAPAADLTAALIDPLPECPGTRIGPYKLLQKIGEGGMGVVYMAEQETPVRRRVALKIIKPGMDSSQVIARFEAERQALAMMDHINIARIFDAGTVGTVGVRDQESGVGNSESGGVAAPAATSLTPDPCHLTPAEGRPYFVMELVHGVPITKYCDDNHLTPRQRLELFVPVCQAVQHAHQKGIIHRDLKPSNVMVCLYDGKPVPKVIDFGVAKATEQRLTERTLFTLFGWPIGTLEYMSPEQAEVSQLGVDTRSDIYSLGVLLYELLTGTTPLQRRRLREAGYAEILRLIREEEPPRPSTWLSSSGEALVAISAQRGMDSAKLSKLIRGELDWIVMKALEKDRTRRFETANAFARDVERYLHDEPVEACPPSAAYRMRKLARKYRTPLGVAAAILLLVFTGGLVSAWQAVRATNAENDAIIKRDRAVKAEQEKDVALKQIKGAQEETAATLKELEESAKKLRAEKLHSDRLHYAADMRLVGHAWEQNDVATVHESLAFHRPKEPGDAELRGFEWYYWDRLSHTELRTFAHGSKGSIVSLAFNPKSGELASASNDKTIKIWDPATSQLIRTLQGQSNDYFNSVAYSPDGELLASASGNWTITIWKGGDPVWTYRPASTKGIGPVYCLAFSPDGQWLASGWQDKTVKIWNTKTWNLTHSLRGHPIAILNLAFSFDGTKLASTSADKTVIIWNTDTWQPARTFQGSVAFSQDGRLLMSSSLDQTATLYESTGEEMWKLKGFMAGVAFRPPDSKQLAVSAGRTIRILDAATGQELRNDKGHLGDVFSCVAFSPDGRLLASGGKNVTIWDAAAGQQMPNLKGHSKDVLDVTFSPKDKLLASASADKTIIIWDAVTGKKLWVLDDHSGTVHSVAFSPDGQQLASASEDQTVKIWNPLNGKLLCTLQPRNDPIHAVSFSPDGRHLASMGVYGTITIWDAAARKRKLDLNGASHFADFVVAYSPDGRLLASPCADGTVKIWDLTTGKQLRTLKGHSKGVSGVAYSPDGRLLASARSDQTVILWDAATGEQLRTLKGHARYINKVAFSPDSKRLASASPAADGGSVKLWDVSTGQELLTFKADEKGFQGVCFSADGRRLAAGCANDIMIWDATPRAQEASQK